MTDFGNQTLKNSNDEGLTMSLVTHAAAPRDRVGASFPALFEQIRHRRLRRRNLAELKKLHGERLQDIGLSEEARRRIIGTA